MKKMKRQATDWKKMFANIPRIYKELKTQQRKSNSTRHEQTFCQGGDKLADKHVKRFSTSLAIRKMQIKTTVRYTVCLEEELNKKY